MSFTVGQLAKLTGLTVRALHHYDAVGLLTPSQRASNGYRLYTSEDVAKLFRIRALQSVGLSLGEIEQVLANGGGSLPTLIAQQLADVDSQIEKATALRDRLLQLQSTLQHGDEPAAHDWIAAVELITQFGERFSADELERLLVNRNRDMDEWQRWTASLRHALDAKLAPTESEAQSLLKQWLELLLRRVGGDVHLAVKMKLAYAGSAQLQARLEAEGGVSAEMMTYLSQVMAHTHRALWSKHLDSHELRHIDLEGNWQRDLLPTIGALLNALDLPADVGARDIGIRRWRELLATFANGDAQLAGKIESILCGRQSDPELARMWLISSELQEFMRAHVAQESASIASQGVGHARLQ